MNTGWGGGWPGVTQINNFGGPGVAGPAVKNVAPWLAVGLVVAALLFGSGAALSGLGNLLKGLGVLVAAVAFAVAVLVWARNQWRDHRDWEPLPNGWRVTREPRLIAGRPCISHDGPTIPGSKATVLLAGPGKVQLAFCDGDYARWYSAAQQAAITSGGAK